MIASRRVSLIALVLALVAVLTFAPSADAATNHVYNGITAAAYADRYACDGVKCYNHSFKYIADDCTNFVSQVVSAGGNKTTALWRPYSLDWSYVVNLYVVFKAGAGSPSAPSTPAPASPPPTRPRTAATY
jgi:hypothetical protein